MKRVLEKVKSPTMLILVAKRFTWKEDIVYNETFSHVSPKDSFRIVMMIWNFIKWM